MQSAVVSTKSQGDYIDRTFGPGGYLSKVKKGYVPREGQITFARAVDQCFREGTPLLGQAPCGTGKAIGYLVPAIFHAVAKKKRVIIATATNSLLDQLSKGPDCELAMLQRALPVKFKYATLKGKSNYLCYRAFEAFDPDLIPLAYRDGAKKLRIWGENTRAGDRGEAPEMEARNHWWKMSVSPEDCTKPSCLYSKRDADTRGGAPYCLAEFAKDNAKTANVIVTNIHYLITHLKNGETALPEADFFVLDEGHELPDITREFWGGEYREKDFDPIVAYAYMMERSRAIEAGTAEGLRKNVRAFFDHMNNLTMDPVKIALKEFQDSRRKFLLSDLKYDVDPIKKAIKACAKVAKITLDEGERSDHEAVEGEGDAQKFRNHVLKVWEMLDNVAKVDPEIARWVDVERKDDADDVSVKYRPIDVGGILREKLFKAHPATVIASATLSAGDNFAFIKRELGLTGELRLGDRVTHVLSCDVPSPFDFKNQCLLIIPKDARDPREYEPWMQHVFKTLRSTIEYCDGRTLGLFTSRKAMEDAAAWLRKIMPLRTILVQGDYAPSELSKRFKEEHESVLLGTRSFWTGLDIPGESLTAVVIDKLPIPQPEPLLEAMYKKMGGAYFDKYLYPRGAITFQQGCGRGVRSITDVAVIVVCDARVYTKPYGKVFLGALPAMETCDNIAKIPEFLRAARWYVNNPKR